MEGRRSSGPGLINDKITNGGLRFLALESNDNEINGDQPLINGRNSISKDTNLELNGAVNLEFNGGTSWKRIL